MPRGVSTFTDPPNPRDPKFRVPARDTSQADLLAAARGLAGSQATTTEATLDILAELDEIKEALQMIATESSEIDVKLGTLNTNVAALTAALVTFTASFETKMDELTDVTEANL